MKTIKSLLKAIKGSYLEPSDQRRIDNFLLDFKSAFFTILVILIIVFLLSAGGAFSQ